MSKEEIRKDLNESIASAMDDAYEYPDQAVQFIAEAAGYAVDLCKLEEGDA